MDFYRTIIQRTQRVPLFVSNSGNGGSEVLKLDAVLLSVGFKLSQELMAYLGGLHPIAVREQGARILAAVRELVGDHVKHNAYFRDYPENIPETHEFWWGCILNALGDPRSCGIVSLELASGRVNLLDLPTYGRYQHSHEEMVAAQAQLIPSLKDRVTILHLGKSLEEETCALYQQIAGSTVPVNQTDRELLVELAEVCLDEAQPESVPVRENLAILNQVRIKANRPLVVDTVTDVLRLAALVSGGDVTLAKLTRFKSFPRKQRGKLLQALDQAVGQNPTKLADVKLHEGAWKRLGEKLHPHEFPGFAGAQSVFAVARGDLKVTSLAGRVEVAINQGEIAKAIGLLATAPGMLVRSLLRLVRLVGPKELESLYSVLPDVLGKVSGRVLLGLREELGNCTTTGERIFVNKQGKAWVAEDNRAPLDPQVVQELVWRFDRAISARLPEGFRLVVDPQILTLALPLSEKTKMSGFGIMPRGSTFPIEGEILRFFTYWKQRHERTDFDLSCLMLDGDFQYDGHISWTNWRDNFSGDIVDAPNGASEFIDVNLNQVTSRYVIPQVNMFCGEGFNGVEESLFGYMLRTRAQKGLPFEAQTVRMKSDMRGDGRVTLPLVFMQNEDGWQVKWLHLFLTGQPNCNTVEGHQLTTSKVIRSVVGRQYLTLGYLVDLMKLRVESMLTWQPGEEIAPSLAPTLFLGLETPEGLPENTQVYNLQNLSALIPE